MGDVAQVLPLYASPHGQVSSDMGRQIMNAAVSIYKKIKFPKLDTRPFDNLEESCDVWWFLFGAVPFCCMHFAFVDLGFHMLGDLVCSLIVVCLMVAHLGMMVSVIYWYRDKPFQLVGAEMKFIIEVVPILVAAAFNLLEFNSQYLALQLGCCTYVYFFTHVMHLSYDITGVDVLLGLFMQVYVYTLTEELLVKALTLCVFVGLCFYRYKTYQAPEIPTHRKKELEEALLC